MNTGPHTNDRLDSPATGPLAKATTGIAGLDLITFGGLPRGRNTLLVGGPGVGKTVLALQTLIEAAQRGEPGLFVSFEESRERLIANMQGFDWPLTELLDSQRLAILDVRLPPDVVASGAFDLSALLQLIDVECERLGSQRIVLDALDALLELLQDARDKRQELLRLHDWLMQRGLTSILTTKADLGGGEGDPVFHMLQYLVDCVIRLDRSLEDSISLRSLRIEKYRGSAFWENEFPITITSSGLTVSAVGLGELDYPASRERVSLGLASLDQMLGGGVFRGSGTLVSGKPGTAKTTIAGLFALAALNRGERAMYVSFDEAASEIVRNLASVNIQLGRYHEQGQLVFLSIQSAGRSSELHLHAIYDAMQKVKPQVLVIDPLSAVLKSSGSRESSSVAARILRSAKADGVTFLCTSLNSPLETDQESTATEVSTIADTWIHLDYRPLGGERNRTLTIIKSRGTGHSNQVRELLLSNDGLTLAEVYAAGGEVLLGTARWEREEAEREKYESTRSALERLEREFSVSESELEAKIGLLQIELERKRAELSHQIDEYRMRLSRANQVSEHVRQLRSPSDREAP